MNIELEPGTYVLAISGGVDSVVLLDLLVKQGLRAQGSGLRKKNNRPSPLAPRPLKLIIAHYDHGIREDSETDRKLVQDIASRHGLSFVFDMGKLGPDASEAHARKARYEFLHRIRQVTNAKAVVTAHHQDDLIETAILNLLRGTGRKGLTSLGDDKYLRRPLLHVPKKALHAYAKKHGLKWHEDVTNKDTRYKRNYVRENIVKKLTSTQREQLVQLIHETKKTNEELDAQIANLLQSSSKNELERSMFINLPHKVALEAMAAWLRAQGIREFDKKLLGKLVTNSKTLTPGKQIDVDAKHFIKVAKQKLTLEKRK